MMRALGINGSETESPQRLAAGEESDNRSRKPPAANRQQTLTGREKSANSHSDQSLAEAPGKKEMLSLVTFSNAIVTNTTCCRDVRRQAMAWQSATMSTLLQ